jgi:hypothetical protein
VEPLGVRLAEARGGRREREAAAVTLQRRARGQAARQAAREAAAAATAEESLELLAALYQVDPPRAVAPASGMGPAAASVPWTEPGGGPHQELDQDGVDMLAVWQIEAAPVGRALASASAGVGAAFAHWAAAFTAAEQPVGDRNPLH